LKEIGSNFHLESNERCIERNCSKYNDSTNLVYLDSGRSAIKLAIQNSFDTNKIAILPMFTCHAVIQPFIEYGYELRFYDIDINFNVNLDEFIKLVDEVAPSVVLIHSYFGFDTLTGVREYLKHLRKAGVCIIEDITHSYYMNEDNENVDFFVCSIRKWLGIPDGGFLRTTNSPIKNIPLTSNDLFVAKQVEAMTLKSKYLASNEKELKLKYSELFTEAKKMLDIQREVYKISDFSRNILQKSDITSIKEQRRSNYFFLLQYISQYKEIHIPFDTLQENEVPLYFPLLINNRAEFRMFMTKNNVFLPIIWPISDLVVFNSSSQCKNIYEKIICIPCDQRYTNHDMLRIVQLINEFLKGAK